jgi:hypothetical protein
MHLDNGRGASGFVPFLDQAAGARLDQTGDVVVVSRFLNTGAKH